MPSMLQWPARQDVLSAVWTISLCICRSSRLYPREAMWILRALFGEMFLRIQDSHSAWRTDKTQTIIFHPCRVSIDPAFFCYFISPLFCIILFTEIRTEKWVKTNWSNITCLFHIRCWLIRILMKKVMSYLFLIWKGVLHQVKLWPKRWKVLRMQSGAGFLHVLRMGLRYRCPQVWKSFPEGFRSGFRESCIVTYACMLLPPESAWINTAQCCCQSATRISRISAVRNDAYLTDIVNMRSRKTMQFWYLHFADLRENQGQSKKYLKSSLILQRFYKINKSLYYI